MRIIRVMCSGRVDPVLILEAFMCGSDGVFIGACLPGECHYADGNFNAMGKVELTEKVLANLGINPDRLVMRMMSSAQGAKFVDHVRTFQDQIKELGRLGSTEGLEPSELELKLKAAKAALQGKKLRWVAGKYLEFRQQGNLYGEKFTQHEFNRLFEEVAMDECAIQEILLRTQDGPLSVKNLAELMGLSPRRVLRHLVDMRKMGLVVLESHDQKPPSWRAAVSPAEAIESEKTK
ncbi:MAG: hydrogenase iron-sulfur subunit [Candidatus Zixiibacteriota bacterium]